MNENFDLNTETFGEQQKSRIKSFVYRVPYGFNEKSYNESREIKKISRLSGASFLCLLIFSSLLKYILPLLFAVAGFSLEKTREILSDAYVLQFIQILASVSMFIIPFALFFKVGGYKISKIIDFSLPKTKNWFAFILMGISFCAFTNIAVSIAGSIFESFGVNYDVDFGENPTGIFGVILTVLSTAVIPPLVEEFACRGVLLGALRKFGDGFAIMVSAIMFGLMHGNFQQAPFAFLIGLVLGFITVKCGSIWPAILIHAYNNLSSVIFQYAFADVSVNMQSIIYTFYLTICLLLGIVGLIFLKNDKYAFKISPSNTESGEEQKYKWFFLTEITLFVILICIYDALKYFKF